MNKVLKIVDIQFVQIYEDIPSRTLFLSFSLYLADDGNTPGISYF